MIRDMGIAHFKVVLSLILFLTAFGFILIISNVEAREAKDGGAMALAKADVKEEEEAANNIQCKTDEDCKAYCKAAYKHECQAYACTGFPDRKCICATCVPTPPPPITLV